MIPAIVAGGMPGPLSSTTMRVGLPDLPVVIVTLMTGAISGFLGSIDGVIDQLLDDDARPLVGLVAGLRDQFLLSAELHQPRCGERHPLDLVRRFVRLLLRDDQTRSGAASRPNRARATLIAPTLQPKAAAMTGALSPRSHISCSSCRRSAVQLMRDLTSADFAKTGGPDPSFSLLNRGWLRNGGTRGNACLMAASGSCMSRVITQLRCRAAPLQRARRRARRPDTT